jgi:hypothetical protein
MGSMQMGSEIDSLKFVGPLRSDMSFFFFKVCQNVQCSTSSSTRGEYQLLKFKYTMRVELKKLVQ